MIRLAVATLLFGALAGAAPPAPAVTVDALVARLGKASEGVNTLAGEFTQKNKLKLFKQELRSTGKFYFERPRRIRWEYLAPDPSTLILDGDTATLRTPGAAPQTFDLSKDATMRAIFEQLLTWLGPGSMAQAGNDYDLSALGSAAEPQLLLVPKASSPVAKAFRSILLRLDGKTLLMRSILLTERNGDEKEITFTHLQRNAAVPAGAFK